MSRMLATPQCFAYMTPMALRTIIIHPDPRLKKKAEPIGYDEQVRALKKRVREGEITVDEYQVKKKLLDDIYGDD